MSKNIFDDIDVESVLNPPPEAEEGVNVFDGIDLDILLTPEEIKKKKYQIAKEQLYKVDKNTVEKEIGKLGGSDFLKKDRTPKTIERFEGKEYLQVGKSPAKTIGSTFLGKGLGFELKESEKFYNIIDWEARQKAFIKQHPKIASLSSGFERMAPQWLTSIDDFSKQIKEGGKSIDLMLQSKDPNMVQAATLYRSVIGTIDPIGKLNLPKTIDMMTAQIENFSIQQPGDELGVTGLWEAGRYKESIDLGYRQALQSAPLSTFAGIMTMTGNPVAAAMMMGIPAYGQKMIDLKDSDLDIGTKRWNAFLSGSSEAISEVGGALLGMAGAKIALGVGRQAAIKQFTNIINKELPFRLTKYGLAYLIDSNVEGLEEWANQIAINAVDYHTGVRTDNNLTEGALEAYVSGTIAAAFMEAPSQVMMTAYKENVAQSEQKQKAALDRINFITQPKEGVVGVKEIVIRSKEDFKTEPVTESTGNIILKGKMKKGDTFESMEEIKKETPVDVKKEIDYADSKAVNEEWKRLNRFQEKAQKQLNAKEITSEKYSAIEKFIEKKKNELQKKYDEAKNKSTIDVKKDSKNKLKLEIKTDFSKGGNLREYNGLGQDISVTVNGESIFVGKNDFYITLEGDEVVVGNIKIKGKFQGKGYATELYTQLAKEASKRGMRLVSSDIRYGPGQKMWKSFHRKGLAKSIGNNRFEFIVEEKSEAEQRLPEKSPFAYTEEEIDRQYKERMKKGDTFESMKEIKKEEPMFNAKDFQATIESNDNIQNIKYGVHAKVVGNKWFATIAKSTKEKGKFQVSYFTNESKQAIADTQESTYEEAILAASETLKAGLEQPEFMANREKSGQELFDEMIKQIEDRETAIKSFTENNEAFPFETEGNTGKVIVSKQVGNDGWRVTYFSSRDGLPVGHSNRATWAEAVETAVKDHKIDLTKLNTLKETAVETIQKDTEIKPKGEDLSQANQMDEEQGIRKPLVEEKQIPKDLQDIIDYVAKTQQVDISKARIATDFGQDAEFKALNKAVKAITTNDIVWVTGLDKYAGVQYNKKIYMDTGVEMPFVHVAVHEAMHQVQKNNPEQYGKLLDIFNDELTKAGYDIGKVAADYKKRGYTGEQIPIEALNDFVGHNATKQEFWDKLAAKAPEFARELIRTLQRFIDKLNSYVQKTPEIAKLITDKESIENILDYARTLLATEIQNNDELFVESFVTDPETKANLLAEMDDTYHRIQFMRMMNNPLYSYMAKVIYNQFPAKMKANSIINWMKKKGVKPVEIMWSRIDEKIEAWEGEYITRDEMLYLADDHEPRITDIIYSKAGYGEAVDKYAIREKQFRNEIKEIESLGNMQYVPFEDVVEAFDEQFEQPTHHFPVFRNEDYDFVGIEDLENELVQEGVDRTTASALVAKMENMKMLSEQSTEQPRHDSPYRRTEGGEDYTELLMIIESPRIDEMTWEEYKGKITYEWKSGNIDSTELSNLIKDGKEKYGVFVGPDAHYGSVENIASTARFQTKIINGKKVLFIEEFQSDWAQKINEEGYFKPFPTDLSPEELLEKHENQMTKDQIRTAKHYGGLPTDNKHYQRWLSQEQLGAAPFMPYGNTDWVMLITKRVTRWAIENGFDAISWTTGKQQIDRWQSELRKNVDEIVWAKENPSDITYKRDIGHNFPINLSNFGFPDKLRPRSDMHYIEFNNNGQTSYAYYIKTSTGRLGLLVIDNVYKKYYAGDHEIREITGYQEDEIYDLLDGNDIQQVNEESVNIKALKDGRMVFGRIIPLEGTVDISGEEYTLNQIIGRKMANDIRQSAETKGNFTGDNLSIGGTFHKRLYDEIIPKYLQKLLGKMGGKVENEVIIATDNKDISIIDDREEFMGNFGLNADINIPIDNPNKNIIRITAPISDGAFYIYENLHKKNVIYDTRSGKILPLSNGQTLFKSINTTESQIEDLINKVNQNEILLSLNKDSDTNQIIYLNDQMKQPILDGLPMFMAKQNDTSNISTKDLDATLFRAVNFMAGRQTSDPDYKEYKINGKRLYNKDAQLMDYVLEEVTPAELSGIHDETGKPDKDEFFQLFRNEYDSAYNHNSIEVSKQSEAEFMKMADEAKEVMERAKALREGKIPKEFRKNIISAILPSRSRKSRLFGLLGNKNTSIPLFDNMFTKWVEQGAEIIVEPYGGAFTLGTHALKNAINAGLKEFHSNVFDKEKFAIIEAIRQGKAADVVQMIKNASDEFNLQVMKAAESSKYVEGVMVEFMTKYPDQPIGGSKWIKFLYADSNYAADAINFDDIYEEWRKTFQTAMDNFESYKYNMNTLQDAVNVAFGNVIGIFSGKGQSMIGTNGFRSYEDKIFSAKYGMIAAVNDTNEMMTLAKEKGAKIIVYSEDGAKFLDIIDNMDPTKTGIYLDPPYINSAIQTYKDKAIDDVSVLNKYINPEEFIKTHAKAIQAANDGARIGFTNDVVYEYMKTLTEFIPGTKIFAYKEGNTKTSLIVDAATEPIAKEYFKNQKKDKKGKTEEYEDPAVAEEKKKLRIAIGRIATIKGMTATAKARIVKKISGHASTTHKAMTIEELQKILQAIKKERPDKIMSKNSLKTTITKKTEAQIQELKAHLIATERLTQPHFQDIVIAITDREFFEPRYYSKTQFVTQSEGRQIIKAMLDSSEWIKRDVKIEKAKNAAPGFKAEIERIRGLQQQQYAYQELKDVTSGLKKLMDWRYFADLMEKATGKPFGRVWMELINKRHEAQYKVHEITDKMHAGISRTEFMKILGSDAALNRIDQLVASNLPEYIIGKPSTPENATAAEKKIAKYISDTLKTFETSVRYQRFMEFYNQYHTNIDGLTQRQIDIAKQQWLPNAPAKAIQEAVKIYESKGADNLYSWMDKQSFAVIRTGYDIGEVISPKVRNYQRNEGGISSAHLSPRESIVYHKYDRNIMSRFASYVRQMVYRSELRNEVNAWMHMVNANINAFDNNKVLTKVVNNNITEILGRAEYRTMYEKILYGAYAQAARAIFLDPRKGIRNLGQNIAFHTGIVSEIGTMRKLTGPEKKFFETHVSQMSGIVHDLLFQEYSGLGAIPGFKQLNQFADWANVIGRTDTINRLWDYSMIMGKLKKKMKDYNEFNSMTPAQIRKLQKDVGIGELTTTERIHAMEILISDGKHEFMNYIASSIIKKDHFVYDRFMRSPDEQGSDLVKILSNLTTFPKGYIQRQVLDIKKIIDKTERQAAKGTGATGRAFRSILWSTFIGASIANAIYRYITGDDEGEPYSFRNVAFKFSLGGIAVGAQENLFQFSQDVLYALTGDEEAGKRAVNEITKLPNMFIPLANNLVDVIEASTDTQYLNSYIAGQIKEAIYSRYNAKDLDQYTLKRDFTKALKHAIMGTEPTNAFKITDNFIKEIKKGNFKDKDDRNYAKENVFEILEIYKDDELLTNTEYMKLRNKIIRAMNKYKIENY